MLDWSKQFSILLFLDSNSYHSPYSRYECLLAAGSDDTGILTLDALQQHHDANHDWLFGHIGYDLKNVLEPNLVSGHPAKTGFPDLHFFSPSVVCHIDPACTCLTIESTGEPPEAIYEAILNSEPTTKAALPKLHFQQATDKAAYLQTVRKLIQHIADGDCYEINLCTEGYCEDAVVDPCQVFSALNKLSPAPFAAYYRLANKYMMCASPERYIQKQGEKLVAQPIKGTAPRNNDATIDEATKAALYNSVKERAENVMITDLMRNDLARVCKPGSVHVDELFGIYSFPQVHQMISTISGEMKAGIPFTDALRYSFPMGSMTGAPKVMVMQLIERYETSRRELFSGTVGYVSPHGDFDFNVIIRSLFYNAQDKYLSYQTGGAITYDSLPEAEWDEMRLKAWALERIFV